MQIQFTTTIHQARTECQLAKFIHRSCEPLILVGQDILSCLFCQGAFPVKCTVCASLSHAGYTREACIPLLTTNFRYAGKQVTVLQSCQRKCAAKMQRPVQLGQDMLLYYTSFVMDSASSDFENSSSQLDGSCLTTSIILDFPDHFPV